MAERRSLAGKRLEREATLHQSPAEAHAPLRRADRE